MGISYSSEHDNILHDLETYIESENKQYYNQHNCNNPNYDNEKSSMHSYTEIQTKLIRYEWFEKIYTLENDSEKLEYFKIDFDKDNITNLLLTTLELLLISRKITNKNLLNISDVFFKNMLDKNINLISCLKQPSEEQYIMIIHYSCNNNYIKNIPKNDYTQNMIVEIIKKDYKNIEFIPKEKMNSELYKFAVMQNIKALEFICNEHKTLELCQYAFSIDKKAINYIAKTKNNETLKIVKELIKNISHDEIANIICSNICEKKHYVYDNNFYDNVLL